MKITDSSLLKIQNSHTSRGNVGVDGEALKIKSGNPLVAWIKSKFSQGAKNAQARATFVNKLAKDLNLDRGLKGRLEREIGITKRSPFKLELAQAKIKEFTELATLVEARSKNKVSDQDAFKPFFEGQKQGNVGETVEKKRPVISEQLSEKIRDRPAASNNRILEKMGFKPVPEFPPIDMKAFEHQDTNFFEDEPSLTPEQTLPKLEIATTETVKTETVTIEPETIETPHQDMELKIEERIEEQPIVLSTEPKLETLDEKPQLLDTKAETTDEKPQVQEKKKLPNSHFMRIAGLIKDAPSTPTTTPSPIQPQQFTPVEITDIDDGKMDKPEELPDTVTVKTETPEPMAFGVDVEDLNFFDDVEEEVTPSKPEPQQTESKGPEPTKIGAYGVLESGRIPLGSPPPETGPLPEGPAKIGAHTVKDGSRLPLNAPPPDTGPLPPPDLDPRSI